MSDPLKPEKSLLDIWVRGFPLLPKNGFNRFASLSGLFFGLIPLILGGVPAFWRVVVPLAELSVQIIAGLIGFIVAAYAIFASSSNPNFMVEMGKHVPDQSRIPLLKIHLLHFVKLFVYSFAALVILMAVIVVGRLAPATLLHVQLDDRLKVFVEVAIFGVVGCAWSTVGVQIKSVVFNLYDLTLTQVRFLKVERERKDNLARLPTKSESKPE